MPEETVGAADLATCECDPCKRKKGLPHRVHSATIHDYSSAPRNGWRVRRTTAETREGSTLPTFGVELETSVENRLRLTDLPNRPLLPYLSFGASDAERAAYESAAIAREEWHVRNREHRLREQSRYIATGAISAEEAVSMAAPRGLWHSKHDGSVTGPEFASHPATLAYWRHAKPHLTGMFKSLLHGGLRSHDGDTCGLHINIGNDAFDNADHLYRFATMLHVNHRWTVRMSMRTNESTHWARFDALDEASERQEWARQVFRNGWARQERYSVLNANNPGRIEFRLPRGTLRLDRFYAKLEWTAAMIEYTRDPDHKQQPSLFMHWAKDSGEYPELVPFMLERFPARFTDGPEAPTPAPPVAEAPRARRFSRLSEFEDEVALPRFSLTVCIQAECGSPAQGSSAWCLFHQPVASYEFGARGWQPIVVTPDLPIPDLPGDHHHSIERGRQPGPDVTGEFCVSCEANAFGSLQREADALIAQRLEAARARQQADEFIRGYRIEQVYAASTPERNET